MTVFSNLFVLALVLDTTINVTSATNPLAYDSDADIYLSGAGDPEEYRLWPGTAPGDHPGEIGPEQKQCLYKAPIENCTSIKLLDVTVPTLIPFLVKGATAAVVIAPGGGYNLLAFNREGTDIAAWLNSIGVSAFVLKYRVPARKDLAFGAAPLMDAQRAMGLVRQMAEKGTIAGLDKSKIGFMGFSAGGHLTGHINVAWKSRTYPRADDADDLPCKPDFAIMVYPWRSVSQAPVNEPNATADLVTKDTAPTMLAQAEDDPVHMENALFYYLALKQKGAAPSDLHIYPRGGHGYGRCNPKVDPGAPFHEVCTWPDRGTQFLQDLGVAPKMEIVV